MRQPRLERSGDWAELVHLLGVALWVGGLGYFATLFWWSTFREPSAASELAWAIPAFSVLAVGSVGLLTVSGLYLTLLHLGSLDHLLSTLYGRILLANSVSWVSWLPWVSSVHRPPAYPRESRSIGSGASPHSQWFRQTLRIEALLGLLALLLAHSWEPPLALNLSASCRQDVSAGAAVDNAQQSSRSGRYGQGPTRFD